MQSYVKKTYFPYKKFYELSKTGHIIFFMY